MSLMESVRQRIDDPRDRISLGIDHIDVMVAINVAIVRREIVLSDDRPRKLRYRDIGVARPESITNAVHRLARLMPCEAVPTDAFAMTIFRAFHDVRVMPCFGGRGAERYGGPPQKQKGAL